MKKLKLLSILWIISLLFIVDCHNSPDLQSNETEIRPIDIFQLAMMEDINFARTNPSSYADIRLKILYDKGIDNGGYFYMKNLSPRQSLIFNNSLNIAASDYVKFLADHNVMGHTCEGTPLTRAIKSGYQGISIGENIAASSSDEFSSDINTILAAQNFVQILIIDMGVSDLGHRMLILSDKYTTAGFGYIRNPKSTYINYVVQEFGDK